ncbi:hypothetical protein [Gaoshiqia sediminis]|uniref:Uncharacterized protein n=1 Tax=Gaoshiqia sediminis TaxID=2986998 RepID=A0AA41Y8J9_9BACT|nr:hypothetical protein [Gaoshiqia sediminis]MCW0481283.1 hypothetical protein [Gaoshiqia sediminis]
MIKKEFSPYSSHDNTMIKSSLILCFIFLISLTCFSQEKEIRIGPSPHINQLEPLIIYDGFPMTLINHKTILDFPDQIESVSIKGDTLFDAQGVAIYKGVVLITSKDSINAGLKQILKETDFWIHDNFFGLIEINGQSQQWDSVTWSRLSGLNPENIIRIEALESNDSGNQKKGHIKLMIKD